MTTKNLLNARRVIVLSGLALLAVAASAAALPLGIAHQVDTPAGSIAAGADGSAYSASTCISPATPALPALPAVPAVPLPLPIGVPALPSAPDLAGSATVCADASPDGVHASADANAAGVSAGTKADVDTSEHTGAVKGAANQAKGFLEGLASKITGWF